MLWQGSPRWDILAREAFHVRKVAIYFAVLLAWSVASAVSDGRGEIAFAASLWLLGFAVTSTGILLALAWGTARTTIYTITSRRLVMRFGIALPMTINLPFGVIESAALKLNPDGSGDIPVSLKSADKVAWLVMWPHARPWRFNKPEPMLRGIENAKSIGELLSAALQAAPAQIVTFAADAMPDRTASARPGVHELQESPQAHSAAARYVDAPRSGGTALAS